MLYLRTVKAKVIALVFIILIVDCKGFSQSVEITDSISEVGYLPPIESVSERKNSIDDFHYSQETNVINLMTAKTSGVFVRSNSGSPGASASIRIRGHRSILFDNDPLIIIDGILIDNSVFENSTEGVDYSNRAIDLNQYDIESIEVIKSVHGNVLYGIRGANGVILITTKKAEKDTKMKINLNYGISIDKVNNLPGYQTEYAQGRPFNGELQWRGPETFEGNSWGPAIADLEYDGDKSYAYDKNGRLVPKGFGNRNKANSYNNMDDFFVNGVKHNFNVSIGGGKNNLVYYFTAGLLNQKGVIPTADFYRKSMKLNIGYDILENLNANFSFNYINSGSNNMTQKGSNLSGVPLGLFRTSPSFDNGNGKTGIDAANDLNTYQLPDGTQRSYRAGIYDSPYWSINKNPTNTNVNRIISQVSLKYDITSNLTLGYQIGIDKWENDGMTGADINSAKSVTGKIEINKDETILTNSDFTINYSKSVTNKIDLEALVGYNYYTSSFSGRKDLGFDFIQPGVFALPNTMEQTTSLNDINQKIAGLYFSVDMEYAKQISLNVSARNDWSSVLPSNNNESVYYGTELIWDAAETFGQKKGFGLWINSSWGRTGNRPGAHLTSTYYNPATVGGDGYISGIPFPQFGVDGYSPNTIEGGPNLAPEITQGYELGFDFEILKSRIGLNYTYFNSKTKGVIMVVPVSANLGLQNLYLNTGEIENNGHEISLYATPLKKRWVWDISINFTKTKNIVTKLHENVDRVRLSGFTSASSNAIVGEPYGALYGNAFKRNDDGKLVMGTDGWPLVDPNGHKVLGNPNPDWIAGIYNKLSYRGISVSALLDIRQGGDVWNGTAGIMNTFGTSQLTADERNITGYVFDGVFADANGDPTDTPNNIPVDFANPSDPVFRNRWNRYGFGGLVEENIQDASWIRLREITITYQLPDNLLRKIGVKSSSVSLTGRNLWLKTNYTGIDPETNVSGNSNGFGLDYFNSPNTKSYGVIFNFNL